MFKTFGMSSLLLRHSIAWWTASCLRDQVREPLSIRNTAALHPPLDFGAALLHCAAHRLPAEAHQVRKAHHWVLGALQPCLCYRI